MTISFLLELFDLNNFESDNSEEKSYNHLLQIKLIYRNS